MSAAELRRLREARRRRDAAEAAFAAAIVAARAAGATLQQVADAAGLTRQRVHAFAFCESLREAACRAVDGYEAAPWGFDVIPGRVDA